MTAQPPIQHQSITPEFLKNMNAIALQLAPISPFPIATEITTLLPSYANGIGAFPARAVDLQPVAAAVEPHQATALRSAL